MKRISRLEQFLGDCDGHPGCRGSYVLQRVRFPDHLSRMKYFTFDLHQLQAVERLVGNGISMLEFISREKRTFGAMKERVDQFCSS